MMVKKINSIQEYLIINYRWILVCFFLLPLSFLYDGWFTIRNWIYFHISSAPKKHVQKVQSVQKQINKWIKDGRKKKLCTSRPGWQTMSFRKPKYKETSQKIVVNLVDILEINLEERWVRVEPMVTMGQVTAALNPMGWTIPVVPELDDLTIGGLVMGTGIESSSHKYGLFQSTCLAYEMVLCDGSVVNCSETENSELFYSIPWSYGTLGILTSVKIKLIPAKPFIELEYKTVRGLSNICQKFNEVSASRRYEFVEGIIFGPEEAVIMTGNFSDNPKLNKINEIGKWYKSWFFKHVENKLKSDDVDVEYIPLRDYYHRHTRSIFWEGQDIIPFGNNTLFRFLFGWLMPPKVSFLKLTQTQTTKKLYEENHVIQDMLIPSNHLKKSIELFHETFRVYPLWLCPFYLPTMPGLVHSKAGHGGDMYVDIGVYGVPKISNFNTEQSTRKIEKFVTAHDGFQMLYADTYTTREEFRKMFDHQLYDRLRKELNCEQAFPEIYDKVSRKARE